MGMNWDYLNPVKLVKVAQDVIVPKKSINMKQVQTIANPPNVMSLSRYPGSIFVRLAGLSGAIAVSLGAYGSHGFYNKPDIPAELKDAYRVANYYHFIHTLALLAVPLTRRPLLVGSLLLTGMSIFCGTCYAYALTGNKAYGQITPIGGTMLIAAWFTMIF